MKYVKNIFADEDILLDDNDYQECKFVNCNLIYSGGKPPSINNCSFENPRITFNEAAGNTLEFIRSLYHGGFKQLIEAEFNNIRLNIKTSSIINPINRREYYAKIRH